MIDEKVGDDMLRDIRLDERQSELSKVFYLEETEICELEMPLIVDVTKVLSGRIIVTSKTLYPVNKFVNLDLTISSIKYSLIGKIKSFKVVQPHYYEITIMLEEIPESLLVELETFFVDK